MKVLQKSAVHHSSTSRAVLTDSKHAKDALFPNTSTQLGAGQLVH